MDHPRSPYHMHEAVWSRLPEDLMQRVLAFLPIPDLLRFRCVCKSWDSSLSSTRSFDISSAAAASQLESTPQSTYLLCFMSVLSYPIIHVFNVSLRKWDELSLSFLPKLDDVSIIKSAGGLLYLKGRAGHRGDTVFLTCNPLTKTWKELPSVFSENEKYWLGISSLTSMAPNSEGGGYRIIEAGLNGLTDLRTKIYNSATESWYSCGRLPSTVTGFESEGVIVSNCLYAVTCLPYKILKMELDGGAWSELSPSLPMFAVCPHLVESLGDLLLVGGFDPCGEEGFIADSTELKIWKLDSSKMEWQELSTLPQQLREKYLSNHCFDSLKCVSQASSIYIANLDGSLVLVYDTLTRSWTRLLECPSLTNHQSCIEHMFTFTPSLQFAL